jgi:hypothetical protein
VTLVPGGRVTQGCWPKASWKETPNLVLHSALPMLRVVAKLPIVDICVLKRQHPMSVALPFAPARCSPCEQKFHRMARSRTNEEDCGCAVLPLPDILPAAAVVPISAFPVHQVPFPAPLVPIPARLCIFARAVLPIVRKTALVD